MHFLLQYLKNLLIRLLENLILTVIKVKKNKVNSKNNNKITGNLAKPNNLLNLFELFIILFTLLL